MKVFVALLLIAATGCGKPVESVPAAVVAESVPAAVVTSPMTDEEKSYCEGVGRIQIEEVIRKNLPSWSGTASMLAGSQQVVLQPAANDFQATHMLVGRVKLYMESGQELIQIWGLYCLKGEPVGAKHLSLGQYQE